jgi:hypothetical protein
MTLVEPTTAETVLDILRRWGIEPPRELSGAQAAAEYDGTSRREIYRDVATGRLTPTRIGVSNHLYFNSVCIDLDRLLPRMYGAAGISFRAEDRKKCDRLYLAATLLGKRPTVEEIVNTLIDLRVLTKDSADPLLAELKN